MISERRHQKRYTLKTNIQVCYQDKKLQTVKRSMAANISNSGAFLPIEELPPLNSRVAIQFLLELDEVQKLRFVLSLASLKELSRNKRVWVTTNAHVIRHEQDGVAVIFAENYSTTPLQPPLKLPY